MGIFDKLFGKKVNSERIEKESTFDNSQLNKSAEPLDEDLYWGIIEKSLKNSSNQDEQEKILNDEIYKLNPKEMIGFRLYTDKLLYDTYSSEMWCAGYIMNGGCSDDSFEYFRLWVISRGKDTYLKAKANPDYLVNEVIAELEFYDFEGFWYISLNTFKRKTGKDLYDFIDYDKFKMSEGNYPQFEFTWDEEDPESMKKICPELFKHFWV